MWIDAPGLAEHIRASCVRESDAQCQSTMSANKATLRQELHADAQARHVLAHGSQAVSLSWHGFAGLRNAASPRLGCSSPMSNTLIDNRPDSSSSVSSCRVRLCITHRDHSIVIVSRGVIEMVSRMVLESHAKPKASPSAGGFSSRRHGNKKVSGRIQVTPSGIR